MPGILLGISDAMGKTMPINTHISSLLLFPSLSGMCVLSHFSHVHLFMILLTVTHQTPMSMGFSRQEYWNGLPFPTPGDLPDPGIEPESPVSPALQADSLPRQILLPLSHWGSPYSGDRRGQ